MPSPSDAATLSGPTARFYQELFALLRRFGLTDVRDLETHPPHPSLHGQPMYDSEHDPWVPEVFEYIARHGEAALRASATAVPRRIVFDHRRGFAKNQLDNRIDALAAYACLFPGRVTFTTDRMVHWPRGTSAKKYDFWYVPYEFVRALLTFKPLLIAGAATVFPASVRYRDPHDDEHDLGTYWHTWYLTHRHEECVEADVADADADRQEHGYPLTSSMQLLRAPWLRGASIENYAELISDEPDAFFLYDRAVSALLSCREPTTGPKVQEAIDEIGEAITRLDILFGRRRHALVGRGATTAVGLLATAFSFLSPELAHFAPGIGSATGLQGATWLYSVAAARADLKAEDCWFIWRAMRR